MVWVSSTVIHKQQHVLSCTPMEALSTLKIHVKMVVVIPTFLFAYYLTGSCVAFLKQCGFNDF
jgi:hypothetical protein